MITAMKFTYLGHTVHIGRDGDGYLIIIDGETVDVGWDKCSSAKAMAMAIIDDNTLDIHTER